MRFSDELAERAQRARQNRPAVNQAAMDEAEQALRDSGILERALGPGQAVPRFSLPNAAGRTVSVEVLLAQGPLVISFYRGAWCAYCNLELRALQQALPQFEELGAGLVAISPQLPDKSLSQAEEHDLEFEILSDVGNRVARSFGLVFTLAEALRPLYAHHDLAGHNGDDSLELPLPATYVVDSNGTILASFVDADYQKRMDPEDILRALEARDVAG